MNTIYTIIGELRKEAKGAYSGGDLRKITNYLDKIIVHVSRVARRKSTNSITTPAPDTESEQTHDQIADRYIAKKAIFDALTQGRHISFLHSPEFKVSEMHTQMHCIRRDIEDKNLPYVLRTKWISVGLAGKRCKEYWLEEKTEESK